MHRRRTIRRDVLMGVGTYLLAAGGGVLIGTPVAIALVAVGSLFMLLAGASTRPAQQHFPRLARLPLVARVTDSQPERISSDLRSALTRKIREGQDLADEAGVAGSRVESIFYPPTEFEKKLLNELPEREKRWAQEVEQLLFERSELQRFIEISGLPSSNRFYVISLRMEERLKVLGEIRDAL